MEIPASLVQQLLNDADKIGNDLSSTMLDIEEKKYEYRSQLINNRIILDDSEIACDRSFTTCGIDGACAIERLVGTDLLIAGAVGVEGLTSTDNASWIRPNHSTYVNAEAHDMENMNIARALMLEMELKLATEAPHDLILVDGSLTTALIHMYKAIDHFQSGTSNARNKLREDFYSFLKSYNKILGLELSDKIWIGIPKYTSRNDIATKLNWKTLYDDKAILSMVLNAGEFTRPILFTDKDAWHEKVPYEDQGVRRLIREVIKGIRQLSFIYYKPHKWSPALRIEVPNNIIDDHEKLSAILVTIKNQCGLPSLIEPYPLYMADRIVKNLGRAIPSYRQIVTRRIVEEKKVNPDDVFFMMQSYRTESDKF
jgi:NurA domain